MGEVGLSYLGHSAFLITTPCKTRILIDPYRNPPIEKRPPWFLSEFPLLHADLVLISHPHFDHDATDRVSGTPPVIRTSGVLEGEDFTVEAVADRHSKDDGHRYSFPNLIFIVRAAGVSLCHIGDNSYDIPLEVRRRVGKVDVAMISVDGSMHLLTYEQVDKVIDVLDPRVVVPMHYMIPGLTDPRSTLKDINSWLNPQKRVIRIPTGVVKVSRDTLPDFKEVWYFERFKENL